MPGLLTAEQGTYARHREDLLRKSEGKYVLIYGEEIAGVFDSEKDAIEQGYERFGNVPFFVKQVAKVETPESFVSSLLGI